MSASEAMSARVRVAPGELSGEGTLITVAGERAHHLVRVLRARVGDRVQMFDGEGRVARGELRAIDAKKGVVEIEQTGVIADGVRGDRAGVLLLQAVPKGDKLETIVRQSTELGVRAVRPVYTERSVPQERGNRGVERHKRLERVAEEAARQCGRADIPAVLPFARLDAAVASLRSDAGEKALRVVAWEEETRPLRAVIGDARGAADGMVVAVGPEGGLSRAEVDALVAEGFVVVSLGPRLLRVETVAPALLGMLSVLRGDLG